MKWLLIADAHVPSGRMTCPAKCGMRWTAQASRFGYNNRALGLR